jgi:uracil-DNA glycosylase
MKFYQFLMQESKKKYFDDLNKTLEEIMQKEEVFPKVENWFKAFKLCDLEEARVVIIGDYSINGLSLMTKESVTKQGILLLNSILTAGEKDIHKKIGWEEFTDASVKALDMSINPIIFVLWGTLANKKARLINKKHHKIIKTSFFDAFIEKKINKELKKLGQKEIEWEKK